jgi:hypothetical protein
MAYTEIKVRNGRRYYYRAISVRRGASVSKQRKYLGSNLSKKDITSAEILADQKFGLAQALLTIQDVAFLERIKLEHTRKGTRHSRLNSLTTPRLLKETLSHSRKLSACCSRTLRRQGNPSARYARSSGMERALIKYWSEIMIFQGNPSVNFIRW